MSDSVDERQKVERLAREVMGWEVDEYGYEDRANGVQYLLSQGDPDYLPWNPYSDPVADYDVLRQVRETWLPSAREQFLSGKDTDRSWFVFVEALPRRIIDYTPGAFARAVDAVLDAREKP